MNEHKESTQDFLIRDVLTVNCGKTLTPGVIDDILGTFKIEMRDGPAAWAFCDEEQPEERVKLEDII